MACSLCWIESWGGRWFMDLSRIIFFFFFAQFSTIRRGWRQWARGPIYLYSVGDQRPRGVYCLTQLLRARRGSRELAGGTRSDHGPDGSQCQCHCWGRSGLWDHPMHHVHWGTRWQDSSKNRVGLLCTGHPANQFLCQLVKARLKFEAFS